MSKLLVENLLRFGAKGLTKSKVFKYLIEQSVPNYIDQWERSVALKRALGYAWGKITNRGSSIFIKSRELVPVTESPEGVTIQFYNNFVTIDNGTANPQQAKDAIDAVIEKFKQAGANLDDAGTTITIRSGATAAKASTGVGQDGADAGKKQIDHTYGIKGDDWKSRFERAQESNEQWGNEMLAYLRGNNVKKYMQDQGVKAYIKVVPQTMADKRFINIEGTTLGDRPVVTLTSLPKITVDASRKIILEIVEGAKLNLVGGDNLGSFDGVRFNRSEDDSYEAELRQVSMQKMKNGGDGSISQEEADKMMPPGVVASRWMAKAGKSYAVVMKCRYNVKVKYNNEYTGQYSTNGETKINHSFTFAHYAGNQRQGSTNYFGSMYWPYILKKLRLPNAWGRADENPWAEARNWSQPGSWSPYYQNKACQDLIKCVGHFTEKAAGNIHENLWFPGSKLTDTIFGTSFIQSLTSPPKKPGYPNQIISVVIPGSTELPLPTVEQYPRLVSNEGKQVLKELANVQAVAKLMSKYQIGENEILNEQKTLDAKGLAEAAAGAGISGASTTIQYKPEYWTAGFFIDFSKTDGRPVIPIELKDASPEIWSQIKDLNLE